MPGGWPPGSLSRLPLLGAVEIPKPAEGNASVARCDKRRGDESSRTGDRRTQTKPLLLSMCSQ
jgi:hypothetical protein